MPIDANPAGQAAALWAGLNLLVMLILSVLVVRQRRKHRVAAGDGGVPELLQAQRAFGNASEYIPTAVAGLVARPPPPSAGRWAWSPPGRPMCS